jgi:DNA-binding transcriptional LysR family regulator
MKPDVLAALAVFDRVAKTKSITQAANALAVTPAALSQTLKKLEAKLGVRLFERTTRSVNFTEAGAEYWERVGPLLAKLKEATEDLQTSAGKEGGTLKITLGHITGAVLIEPLIAKFCAEHPHITVELLYDDGFIDIVREGFDAGIRPGESVAKDMIAVKLTKEFRIITAASPAYLKQHGTPQHPRDLQTHRCINYRMRTSGALYKWEFQEGRRVVEYALKGSLIVNHHGSARRAAIDGVGVIHGLSEGLMPEIKAKRLTEILANYSPSFPGFYFYYPRREHLPIKTRVFLDFLKRELRTRLAGSRASPLD